MELSEQNAYLEEKALVRKEHFRKIKLQHNDRKRQAQVKEKKRLCQFARGEFNQLRGAARWDAIRRDSIRREIHLSRKQQRQIQWYEQDSDFCNKYHHFRRSGVLPAHLSITEHQKNSILSNQNSQVRKFLQILLQRGCVEVNPGPARSVTECKRSHGSKACGFPMAFVNHKGVLKPICICCDMFRHSGSKDFQAWIAGNEQYVWEAYKQAWPMDFRCPKAPCKDIPQFEVKYSKSANGHFVYELVFERSAVEIRRSDKALGKAKEDEEDAVCTTTTHTTTGSPELAGLSEEEMAERAADIADSQPATTSARGDGPVGVCEAPKPGKSACRRGTRDNEPDEFLTGSKQRVLRGHNLNPAEMTYAMNHLFFGDDTTLQRERIDVLPRCDMRTVDVMNVPVNRNAFEIERVRYWGVRQQLFFFHIPRILLWCRTLGTFRGFLAVMWFLISNWSIWWILSFFGVVYMTSIYRYVPFCIVAHLAINRVIKFLGKSDIFWCWNEFYYVPHKVTMCGLDRMGACADVPAVSLMQSWIRERAMNIPDVTSLQWAIATCKCSKAVLEASQGFQEARAPDETPPDGSSGSQDGFSGPVNAVFSPCADVSPPPPNTFAGFARTKLRDFLRYDIIHDVFMPSDTASPNLGPTHIQPTPAHESQTQTTGMPPALRRSTESVAETIEPSLGEFFQEEPQSVATETIGTAPSRVLTSVSEAMCVLNPVPAISSALSSTTERLSQSCLTLPIYLKTTGSQVSTSLTNAYNNIKMPDVKGIIRDKHIVKQVALAALKRTSPTRVISPRDSLTVGTMALKAIAVDTSKRAKMSFITKKDHLLSTLRLRSGQSKLPL